MLELICLITNLNNDKIIRKIHKKYNLPFNLTTIAQGTASSSVLEYFGLEEIKKYIYFSCINSNSRKDIFNDLNKELILSKPGSGICFSLPISSSTKYVKDKLISKEEEKMKNENFDHHLIITIVNEGYTDEVMSASKKAGAGGGTLIRGRSLNDPNKTQKFLGFSIEPEKDVVLIVAKNELKNDIMNAIIKKSGLKTKGNGIIFSIPITDAIGLIEDTKE